MDYHSRGESKPVVNGDGHTNQVDSKVLSSSLKQHVLDLLRVLKSCDQSHSFLVGHGFGGFVGLLAMKLFPNRISGMVLLDSGFPLGTSTSTSDVDVDGKSSTTTALPEHVMSGYMRELELLTDEKMTSEKLKESFFGVNVSEYANEVDINDFINYTLEKRDVVVLRAAAMNDLKDLSGNDLFTMTELFKMRHPVNIVRAEKGFPFENVDQQPLIDEKTAKDLHFELNVKDKVVTVKSANHYSLLTGKNVSQVAKAIESLVCRYDVHWRVSAEFESLKEESPQQRKERLEKMKSLKEKNEE